MFGRLPHSACARSRASAFTRNPTLGWDTDATMRRKTKSTATQAATASWVVEEKREGRRESKSVMSTKRPIPTPKARIYSNAWAQRPKVM